jgi:hypothetical protein
VVTGIDGVAETSDYLLLLFFSGESAQWAGSAPGIPMLNNHTRRPTSTSRLRRPSALAACWYSHTVALTVLGTTVVLAGVVLAGMGFCRYRWWSEWYALFGQP